MSKATETAQKIIDAAARNGFEVQVRGNILTITKNFTPGDMDAFVECDMSYYSVLGCLPMTSPGSDWGTDGGGMGGHSATKSGRFVMNRSGGSVRVLNALKKMI